MKKDTQIFDLIAQEEARQKNGLELIASENYVTPEVLQAMDSICTNKYAEGYPGKRYYGGCQVVDKIEQLAIDRLKALYGACWANVQPHSGAQANLAVEMSVLNPGDTFMGLDLSQGGHLTHGSPVNASGILYNAVAYGLDPETGTIDYDAMERTAKECKPKLIVAGASAYPRIIDFPRLREIADEVGAYLMVDMAHIAGLVAGGVHPNPVPYCDFVTTTTHKTLRGPRGGLILMKEKYAKDINKAVFPGTQGGPLMHTIAAKAVCFGEAMKPEFKEYAAQIVKNCKALADGLISRGCKLVSGGTDNHVLLMDLRGTGVTGKELEARLDECYITVNKNTIPNEPLSPFVTSGVRIGTAAVTTRGLKEDDMDKIAEYISLVLNDFEGNMEKVRKGVEEICAKYPLYE